MAFTVALPQPAHAENVRPPDVPPAIEVPAGNEPFLVGHAVGTQDYICLPSGWTFFGPQATLFTEDGNQLGTYFLSPNLSPIPIPLPDTADSVGTIRATWQHSRDTSTVWAKATANAPSPSDPTGAIPWLLLEVVGAAQIDPTGSHTLTPTTYIQRLNTTGGVAPSPGCTLPTDVGKKALVPYTADYFFYKAD